MSLNRPIPEPTGDDPNLILLRAELARTDVLIRCFMHRREALVAHAGADYPLADLEALLHSPLGATWALNRGSVEGARVDELAESATAKEELEHLTQEYLALVEQTERDTRTARQTGITFRLPHLQHVFGLSQFEMNAFLLALAGTVEPRYARLFAHLQDDLTLRYPTVGLMLDVLCLPGLSRLEWLSRFEDDAPLLKYQLLELGGESGPLVGRSLTVPDHVVSWLFGRYRPHPLLVGWTDLTETAGTPPACAVRDDEILAEEIWPQLVPHLAGHPVVMLVGEDLEAQSAAVRRLADHVERPVLTADLAGPVRHGVPPATAVKLALREARLVGAIPHLHGIDVAMEEDTPPAALWSELEGFPWPLAISARRRWQVPATSARRPTVIACPAPAHERRVQLWRHFLGEAHSQAVDLELLAAQFALSGGEIHAIAAAAMERAAPGLVQPVHLWGEVRRHAGSHLEELAYQIIPRYSWDDLVLPSEQKATLREIITMVRGRRKVLEQWGVGKKLVARASVTVLLAGESGTGKTMAAEVLAHELGLDLYKIDLASLVSKYIGETEKNLERIFTGAERSHAILFFDEADAVFGKRSGIRDSHDRYANIGVSYLLQRMEIYDGITILATNLRTNLDEAFTRRLQFAIDFPFPEAPERLRIWRALLPPELPLAPDVDLELLAERVKLAGGNIRNIVVAAAYTAAEQGDLVTMEHFWHAVRRELKKMGRLVNEAELSGPDLAAARTARPPSEDANYSKMYRVRHRNS